QKKCIQLYKKTNNNINAFKTTNNLSWLYFVSGNLREAKKGFILTERDTKQIGSKTYGNFILSFSLLLACLGRVDDALSKIKEAHILFRDLKHELAVYFEFFGQILCLNNEYIESEKALKKGLELSIEIAPDSDHISQIKRLLGDTYIGLKEYDKAEKITDEALEVAEHLNERVEIAACYRIFAQLENHKGNHSKSREWFKKAIDLFSMISSRYELATTRLMAAQSGLYVNGEKTALLYLAKEYFESEELDHLIEKVNAELEKRSLDSNRINPPQADGIPVVNNGADEGVCRPQKHGNDKEVAHPLGWEKENTNQAGNACVVTHSANDGRWENDNGNGCPNIITVNTKMKKILEFSQNIARSGMNVFITGETGTGKDLLARYIHCHSGLQGKFVTVNAAAIPHDMIEAELFGYRKGAFTGANIDKPGLFEDAHNGTFYLNEIADSTAEFQAKLLEILEAREVRRLGENRKRSVNFRLVAATNFDLKQNITDNKFRLDLYHRLNEIPIHLPPLKERLDDISMLLCYFLTKNGCNINNNGNAKDIEHLTKTLSMRNWDGNIRQFKAEIYNLYLVAHGDLSVMNDIVTENIVISEGESLLKLLNDTNWNQSEVARRLGVSEGAIRKRIKKYNLTQS
ncbi:MAG: sigma 54-interacting transcriptional regulator, partial [Bacteroidota bacterium]|nr:sigma 54-interacting transcriptional regulator [Bacteroidota bacterium]